MGKLHTLRRAIERNPHLWLGDSQDDLCGAIFIDGQWKPYYYFNHRHRKQAIFGNDKRYLYSRKNRNGDASYCNFVKKVLADLGLGKSI